MRKDQRINLTYLKDTRKLLRSNLTPAEAALWKALKNSQLAGRKFRRQHSIDRYIADFCCPSEKLIIELDGQPHFNPGAQVYDATTDEHLTSLGYKVLRFENKLVFENLEGILSEITSHFSTV